MSTKFAVRPAPRKRPWICKRSPPCLEPDPLPPSVMVTYRIAKLTAPHKSTSKMGTFIATRAGPGLTYYGIDGAFPTFFEVTFTITKDGSEGHAWSTWTIGPTGDIGDWHRHPGTGIPSIKWTSGDLTASASPWAGFLLVTS